MPKNAREFREWSVDRKWNPFNSYKLLAQVYRWRLIRRGEPVPQPSLVTVDPINLCNLHCTWCNADFVLNRRHGAISRETLLELADGLAGWRGHPDWPGGVEAVCIAGGGEPLLHPDIDEFIHRLADNGIEVGVVTNGTLIHRHIESLARCTWVGVSVDAGSAEVFARLKGRDLFHKVCGNIRALTEYVSRNRCTLGLNRQGYGVSFKFLLHADNAGDVHAAALMAREIGCRNFHLRPAGIAWDKLSGGERVFDERVRRQLTEQIGLARELESEDFAVFGITHKFDETLSRANRFSCCHAVFMTAVFMPPRDPEREEFCVSLCCDRRGDARLEFGEHFTRFGQFAQAWGGAGHWRIFDRIELHDCPRCTYQPHNQIYEHVIEKDSMTYKFI